MAQRRPPNPKLLVASRNQGKLREYRELLQGVPFQLTDLVAEGIQEEVAETGRTFAENAGLKARRYAAISGLLTLADDSGLEVDALDGEPGVRSSRYAGEHASDADRYRLLLEKLRGVPQEKRTARFHCVIAMAWPSGRVDLLDGVREGIIATGPRGANGFGYDPVFYMPELGATMAELSAEQKNRVSHRYEAARKAKALLTALASDGPPGAGQVDKGVDAAGQV